MRKTKAPFFLDGDIYYGDLLMDDKHCLISYCADLAAIRGSYVPCLA